MNFQPQATPLGPLWLSALVAALPLITIFVLLGVFKVKAHIAALSALAVAIVVALVVYQMPLAMTVGAATEGFAFGLFPIVWIVGCAIWLYQITVIGGRFDDLRTVFGMISDDPRAQALVVAFCFGGTLEALAGFGAPVAIVCAMLMAIGFPPIRGALVVLVANTAPVAYGAVAIPVITAGNLTGIPYAEVGATAGRQVSVIALVVPFLLLLIMDGWRGLKQLWPLALIAGASFGAGQIIASTWISTELTDIFASMISIVAAVVMLRVWHPGDSALVRDEMVIHRSEQYESLGIAAPELTAVNTAKLSVGRITMAVAPYLLILVVFSVTNLVKPVSKALRATDVVFEWPAIGGRVLTTTGEVNHSTTFTWQWLSGPGTLLLLCGIAVAILYRVRPAAAIGEFRSTFAKLGWTSVTIAGVLSLAYVMNLSGQTTSIGFLIAATGAAFGFLSPILGWLGTSVSGSATSANALFANLQLTAAQQAGLDPTLMVAGNTSGAVLGKMMSPQSLAIAAAAVQLPGHESTLLRQVARWSLILLVGLCLLVGLQSTSVLNWMLP